MTEIEIRPESADRLAAYATVPIAFQVRSVLEVQVIDGGLGGFVLVEQACDPAWTKDYDAFEADDPTHWPEQWDLTNWGMLAAFVNGMRAGGCAIAYDTPDVNMLEGRRDLAVVWDLRVAPEYRGRGVGGRLWRAAEAWARERDCRVLKVETQNINVPACRFYARQGCVLGAMHRHAYRDFPDEVQMLWYKGLEELR
jgi:ribosomal protein S18 acetylase RimI-like enzyme